MVSMKLIFETKQKSSPQFIELTDQDKKQLEHLVKMHKKLDKRRLLINAGLGGLSGAITGGMYRGLPGAISGGVIGALGGVGLHKLDKLYNTLPSE